MSINLILGNLFTVMAMGGNAFSSTRKTTKGVLTWQCVAQAVYLVASVVLKGYSAAVQNAVSILRNLTAMSNRKSRFLEWILTAAGLIMGIIFNNRGFLGLLPVLGNLQYTLAIFYLQDRQQLLKLSFLISLLTFCIFNVSLWNLAGAASDMVVIITTAIVLIKERKNKTESSAVKNQT